MDFKVRQIQGFEKLKEYEVYKISEQFLSERYGIQNINNVSKAAQEQKLLSQTFMTDRTLEQDINLTMTNDLSSFDLSRRNLTLERPLQTDRDLSLNVSEIRSRDQRIQSLQAKVKTNQSKLKPLINASKSGILKGDKKNVQQIVKNQQNFNIKPSQVTNTSFKTENAQQRDRSLISENVTKKQLEKSQFFPIELFDPQPDSPQTLQLLSEGPQPGYSR